MRRHGVAASGAIGFVGAVGSSLLGFALVAVVGRGAGVTQTGQFFQFVGWFMIASALLRMGADTGLLRAMAQQSADHRIADLRQTLRVAVVPVAVLSTVVAVVVHLHAPVLVTSAGTAGTDAAVQILRVLAWCLPPAVVLAVLMGGLRGLGSVTAFTVVQNIALPALRVVLVALVLAVGLGGIATVLSAWAAPLPVLTVVGLVLVARAVQETSRAAPVDASRRVSTTEAAWEFWSFSAARGVAAFLETALEWIDVLVVAAFRSPAEAGVYALCTRIVRAGLVVETAVRVAVAPRIATLLGKGDVGAASVLFTAMTRVVILASWPLFLVLIVFAPTVLGVFGEGFASGGPALVILSVAMMLRLATGIVQSLLLMGGRSHYQMGNKMAAVVVNLGLNLLLVPAYGIVGAAVAWAATMVLDTGLATLQVRSRLRVRLNPRRLALPVGLTLGFAGGCAVVRILGGEGLQWTAAAAIASGLVYAALVWQLRRGLELDELVRL